MATKALCALILSKIHCDLLTLRRAKWQQKKASKNYKKEILSKNNERL